MLRFIFAELADEIMKDMIRKHEKETPRNPFLQPIEAEIKRLKNMEEQIKAKLEVMKQLHQWISEIFSPSKTEKPDKTGTQARAETPSAAGSEPQTDTDAPTLTREPEPETPNLTQNEQLEILEHGLRHAVGVLESTKMAYYFKTIKELREYLTALVQDGDAPTPERIAKLDAGLRHAVKVLSESTRAMKSKVTRELREGLVIILNNNA